MEDLVELSKIGKMRDELRDFKISNFLYKVGRDDGDWWIKQIRQAAAQDNSKQAVDEMLRRMLINACPYWKRSKIKHFLESKKGRKEFKAIRLFMIEHRFIPTI
jgi:hypothetical protein